MLFLFSMLQARLFVSESSTSGSQSTVQLFLGLADMFFSVFAVSMFLLRNKVMPQVELALRRC